MGNKGSKSVEPSGPIVEEMEQKYGRSCLRCLSDWSKSYGFPENGSFSVVKLRRLKQDMEVAERKLKERKSIKTEVLKRMDEYNECFHIWMTEAESRERKQMQKQLTLLNIHETDNIQNNAVTNTRYFLPPSLGVVGFLLERLPPPPCHPPQEDREEKPAVSCPTQTRRMTEKEDSENPEQLPASAPTQQEERKESDARHTDFLIKLDIVREKQRQYAELELQKIMGIMAARDIRHPRGRERGRGKGTATGKGQFRGHTLQMDKDICHFCGGRGHWVRQCPDRRRVENGAGGGAERARKSTCTKTKGK